MNQTPDPAPPAPDRAAPPETPVAPRRGGPPRWAGLAFVGLLMVVLVISQFLSRRGADVQWIQNDFERALSTARADNRRILLMLYEPDDPITAGYDRNLFKVHAVRNTLAQMVCCRVALQPNDPLRRQYRFERDRLMLVLDSGGNPLARLEGVIDEDKFRAQVKPR